VDINFAFDGFGVVGRVLTAGTDSGPEGVTISLLTPRGDKQEVVQTTESTSSVTIDIDGVTDQCSTNVDINFAFDGFGVVGRVLTAGTDSGPEGVTISLLTPRGDKQEVVQTTETGAGGTYVFTAVPGTDHQVSAGHPSWVFDKSVGSVSMTGDNGQAEDLIVAGFDVKGSVMSGSEPMAGVSIFLFGPESSSLKPGHCPHNTMT